MYHTIVVILLSGILSVTCVAQEQATAASPKALTDAEAATPNSKAIFLIIDAEAQQSEIVRQVVEALEKAGIATSKAAETAPHANSSISVTLGMRKDVSHDHVTQLVKALVEAGVHRASFREGLYQGGEQNRLNVRVGPGYSVTALLKIYRAVETVKAQCGLKVLVATRGLLEGADVTRLQDDADPVMDSGLVHKVSPIADLRRQYEAASRQAHELATLLRDCSDRRVDNQLKFENERKIEKSLQQMVSLNFHNAPFTEVIRKISNAHGINIVMKTRPITTEGLPTSRPISIDAEEITLGSALTLLLDQAGGLDYHIENEVLMITDGGEPKPAVDDDVENIDNLAAKKAELRTAVQRAFTLRQSLLRAELQEMQARLKKTQQSLDMRERIADQIVDRRVEDLLNPELKWDNNVSTKATESSTSTANAPPKPKTTATSVTELEGDWHLVSKRDYQGQVEEFLPYNRTYWGGRSKSVWSGGGHDSRIEIFPESKICHYFTKDEDTSFFVNHYEIKNDQLIVRNSPDDKGIEVFERGHVRIPSVVPPATLEQKLLWRSAIVEIVATSVNSEAPHERVIGRGVVISSSGKMLSQLTVKKNRRPLPREDQGQV